jgi:hypothetical protein
MASARVSAPAGDYLKFFSNRGLTNLPEPDPPVLEGFSALADINHQPVDLLAFYSPILTGMSRRHERPSHRVYMSFFLSRGWYCQFLETDLKTSLPKKLTFASADKVRELAELGGAIANRESNQMLEDAIIHGRGGVYLNLTQTQYERLRHP